MPTMMFQQPPPNFDHMPIATGNDIDKLLIVADGTLVNGRRNAGVISIAIMRIIQGKRYGLRYLETRYRALDSHTFLIARPSHTAEPGLQVRWIDTTARPYYLWVVVNGRVEANATLSGLGCDAEENLRRLDATGFLVIHRH